MVSPKYILIALEILHLRIYLFIVLHLSTEKITWVQWTHPWLTNMLRWYSNYSSAHKWRYDKNTQDEREFEALSDCITTFGKIYFPITSNFKKHKKQRIFALVNWGCLHCTQVTVIVDKCKTVNKYIERQRISSAMKICLKLTKSFDQGVREGRESLWQELLVYPEWNMS